MQNVGLFKTAIWLGLTLTFTCAIAPLPAGGFHISADHSEWKQATGEIELIGHVVLDQAQTSLQADRLTIKIDKNHKIDAANASGKPAIFHYHPQDSRQAILAKAQKIIYRPSNQSVELIGQAQASQNHNTITGGRISYDIASGHLISDSNENGRTTITLEQTEFNFSKKKPAAS